MNKTLMSAAVGAGAFLLLAGTAAGGYVLHQPGIRTVTVTRTVTQTVPKTVYVTRWKTKTVTQDVAGAGTTPCSEVTSGASGPAFLIAGNAQASGYNGTYEGMCTVTVSSFNSSGNGVVTLTDSSGLSTTYNLGVPVGR
jgi:hypothetical protein